MDDITAQQTDMSDHLDSKNFDSQLHGRFEERVKTFLKSRLKAGDDVGGENFSIGFDIGLGVSLTQGLEGKKISENNIDGALKGTPIVQPDTEPEAFVKLTIDDDAKDPLSENLVRYKSTLPQGNEGNPDMKGSKFPPYQIKEGLYTKFVHTLPGDISGSDSNLFVTAVRPDIENPPTNGQVNKLTVYIRKDKYEAIKKSTLVDRN